MKLQQAPVSDFYFLISTLIFNLLLLSECQSSEVTLSDFHNYTQLMDELDNLAESYPDIAKLYSLGQTAESRELLVMQISRGVNEQRVKLKPMMKLVANMHGNEAVGRELMLALSRYLLENYETDDRVANIIDNTDIHILPSLNPDGFEKSTKGICSGYHVGSGRHNGNNVDLNRAFPSWDDLALSKEELMNRSQPEVSAVIDWVFNQPFVLSANFHDGAVVANYPFDDSHEGNGIKSLTPDDSTFVSLSKLYASKHRTMWQGVGLCQADNFTDGITNGAEWYVVKGGMQDFNYLYSNCMEITVELSCCKYPMETTLQGHWEDNKESLLGYIEAVQSGVRGIVTSDSGEPVANANIEVAGIGKNITTTYIGEYWRLLSPGKYCIRASSPESRIVTNWVQINVSDIDSKKHVRVDFKLSDNTDIVTDTECDNIARVLSHGEDEDFNTIDTETEEVGEILEHNRATDNNLFFLSFLISLILAISI